MQTLLMTVAVVCLLAVVVRFVSVLRRGADVSTAGWESAGWLTLSLIASVVYASTGIDADVPVPDKVTSSHAVRSTDRLDVEASREPVERPKFLRLASHEQVIPLNAPIPDNSTVPIQEPTPVDHPQRGTSRREMLSELHEETIEKFVKSPGFGFRRRIIIRIDEFETPERNRMYLPRNPLLASGTAAREIPLPDRSHWKARADNSSGQQQLQQLAKRLRREAVRTPDNATETKAGREALRPRVVESAPEWDEWEVSDWELVSILKNDPPKAYASHNLQMMHRPNAAALRPLDKLEKNALAKLRQGETMVVAHGVNAIRMVGAVRARANCLQCHKGKKEGDLLGAFSYELHRLQPIALAAKIGGRRENESAGE